MKITGLGLNELEFLWELIRNKYVNIHTFIIGEQSGADERFITATKLIELRNKQDAPLLVLVPSNSRTSAEDSYGNATFKEISLEGIEQRLKEQLINNIPPEFSGILKNEILGSLNLSQVDPVNIVNYLLSLEQIGYSTAAIGDQLYLLNLLPDSALLQHHDKIRSRLNFNNKSTALLATFHKPLYDRIAELPLESNSLQKDLVKFLKTENNARSAADICRMVYQKYPNLNFSNWPVPDLDFKHVKLIAEEIKSIDFSQEEGRQVLKAQQHTSAKVRIRFFMSQNPKEISGLAYFKVILMAVNGGAGDEMQVVKKFKNSNSNRPFRDVTVELNPNMMEEGSYFFKIWAEDEHGNVLE